MPRHRKTPQGYRSMFEQRVAERLIEQGVPVVYEAIKLDYVVPSKEHKYTPDFILPSGIMVECKGRLTLEDRQKMIQVRKDNPDEDIRFVFQNPMNKISKGSGTTYARWCNMNGFIWAKQYIPEEWL